MFDEQYITQIFRALNFAADKHRHQRRKGADQIPYINHPLEVAATLWQVGGVRDLDIVLAAILHDIIEDTDTTAGELAREFNPRVAALVAELSDDKTLPKQERKRLQEERAASLSPGAKLIRLVDKAANIKDVARNPPADWPLARRIGYLDWTARVIAGARGVNAALEAHYDQTLQAARLSLEADG